MKKKYLFITLLLLIGVGFGLFINGLNEKEINRILSKDAYSYLSPQAKDYVKDVYEKTGEVILTEKNKEENTPYLNPQYEDYLGLSKTEQKKVSVIPDSLIIDYSPSDQYSTTNLPSSYDLRNVDGRNYTSTLKNQGTTKICWAFATIENVETLLMKQKGQSYNDGMQQLSVKHLDYVTAKNKLIKSYVNSGTISCVPLESCPYYNYDNSLNASRNQDDGGNFYTSSIVMANALSLVDESVVPWNEENHAMFARDIFNYNNSVYEVDSTIQVPKISEYIASEEAINSFVNEVKSNMYIHGGPFVATYAPNSSCAFKNSDNKTVIKTDECIEDNDDYAHAMQIIGWDDDYEYSYCADGTKHYEATGGTCSKGTYTTDKGAWILRNSWGSETEHKYVYLTYDSTNMSVGFTTSVSEMKNRTWDNNYHTNPWIDQSIANGFSATTSQTQEFDTHHSKSEKVEKIKFLNVSKNAIYNISITSGNNTYNNVATVNVPDSGIYTVDLSNKNVILNNKFTVTLSSSTSYAVEGSISVFTSNVNSSPDIAIAKFGGSLKTYDEDQAKLPSEDNPAFVKSGNYVGDMTFEYYLKGVPANSTITYRVLLDGENYNNYFFDGTPKTNIINDYAYATLYPRANEYSDKPICGKEFTFEILVDDNVVVSFPLKRVCEKSTGNKYTSSNISFHKNDDSGFYTTIKKTDLSNLQLMYADGTGREYIGDESQFFRIDKHIESWNTKADGTGTSYTTNELLVYKDLDLYAQWGNDHYYYLQYECKYGDCVTNQTQYGTSYGIKYGIDYTIKNNSFTHLEGKKFLYWKDYNNIYYEEEVYKNLAPLRSPYNYEEKIYLEAVWSANYNTISFDANSGSGSMKEISVMPATDSRLKYNLFTKENYRFKGWNTKADGTGTSYVDGATINTDQDLILYAQWQYSAKPITSISLDQTNITISRNSSKQLNVTITPEDTTDEKTITWESSNPNIATVVNGRVTGVNTGNTTITARSVNGKTATCVVTVIPNEVAPTSITLNATSITLNEGESYTLVATVLPANATNKTVTWEAPGGIFTVDNNGVVTAIKEGGGSVIARTVNGLEARCSVTVTKKVIPDVNFNDVPKNAWYYEYVKEAYYRGIIAGYSPTRFGPNDKVTRGQLVTFLYRLEGSPSTVAFDNKFSDVKSGEYYTEGVKWASHNGIVNGYGGTTRFGPANPIIRQDLAVILRNYAKYKGYDYTTMAALGNFVDFAKVHGNYAEEAVAWAVYHKIMSGKGGVEIAPFDNTTRAQAATMIVNFIHTFEED